MPRKNIVIIKCDNCGKENRIRESYLSRDIISALNDNFGCYCSKCKPQKKHQYGISFLAGEMFTIYPKVIPLNHVKDTKRAKEILHQGLIQIEFENLIKKTGIINPNVKLTDLFTFLDAQLSIRGCNNKLEITSEFLNANNIPAEPILNWLRSKGGYCDCEVILNVALSDV